MLDSQWGFAVRFMAVFFILAGSLWLINSLAWLIGLLLVSSLIVYILYPFLNRLQRRFNLNHTLSTIIVFCGFLLFCILIVGLFVPVIYTEVTELIDNFPHYMGLFQEYLAWFSEQTINLQVEDEFRGFLASLSDNIYLALEYLADASLILISRAVDFFLVLLLVFFLLHDFHEVRAQLINLVPPAKRDLPIKLMDIIDTNVGTFIRGSLIRCLLVGIMTGVALFIIGMPYALLLSLLAGAFNFILYIGPYIAAVPAIILGFSPLTPSPLLIIAIYIAIQLIDGLLLTPIILGRAVRLKPITVILSILAGGRLAGLLGMVLAVPVAGMIKSLIDLVRESPVYRDEVES